MTACVRAMPRHRGGHAEPVPPAANGLPFDPGDGFVRLHRGKSAGGGKPRQAAEHVVSAELLFSRMVAEASRNRGGRHRQRSQALDGLERTATETDEVLSGVTEQDLGDPAPVGDGQIRYARTRGFELPRTVEGAMMMFVIHEEHHASRIARAKDCRLRGTRAS